MTNAVGRFFSLMGATFRSWNEDKAPRLGAALAFYTVFSLPPLAILLIGMGGLVFERESVQARVVNTIGLLVGSAGAGAIRDVLNTVDAQNQGMLATGIGVFILLIGASGVFGQLKDALNTVWEVEPRPGRPLVNLLREQALAMLVVLGTGFLLVVSLCVNAALAALGEYLSRTLPGGAGLWLAVNFVVSMGVIAVLFALMFKFIPDAVVAWRDALVGGAVTSVLFTVGENLIGLYLGRTNIGSAFGAAGSLVILLVWIYYSSMIFFFGAEFTKIYAQRYGSRIRLNGKAVPVTEEAREQQGIPRHHDPAAS